MSIIRDVTNGIFNLTGRNFNELVMNSYNDLTSLSSFDLFSPTNYIVKYTT